MQRPGQVATAIDPFWAAVEHTPLGVALIDVEGRIERANDALARITGWSVAELESARVAALIDSAAGAGPSETATTTTEQRWLRPRGASWGMTLAWSVAGPEGTPPRAVLLVVDLTPSRLAERARLQQMAAALAHEIKNPIAGVVGALQLIARRSAAAEERHVLESSVERLRGLDAVVERLVEFASPPRLAAQPLRIDEVLDAAARDLRHAAGGYGVSVRRTGASSTVLGDPQLLGRAFRYLLDNAAQAMRGAGMVRVRIEERERRCIVVVADSGPGIPPALREKVFEPFFTTRLAAVGLGLPIARRIIEGHGGELRIADAEGGARVVVELPVARGAGAIEPPPDMQ